MKQNYVLKPQRKAKQAILLCFCLLVLSVTSFYLAELFLPARAFGQLIAAIFLLLFIQITNKYLLTEYEYALEDQLLHLSLRQGKKIKHLGSIPLSDRCVLMTKQEFAAQKKKGTVTGRLSYCQNLFAEYHVLLCPQEKGAACVCLELDETFVRLLKQRIETK